MENRKIGVSVGILSLCLLWTACTGPSAVERSEIKTTPETFNGSRDTVNTGRVHWKEFFKDPYLIALIDTALKNNQELNILLQEINVARNEVRARKGEYLPFVGLEAAAGTEKVSRNTMAGAVHETVDIQPGEKAQEPLPDFLLAAHLSWEVDIWQKLRQAKKSAMFRYLATTEGKNFMVTNLVAEIANSYFELMALDNQLEILKQNIEIQQNALQIVKLLKLTANVTELAVRRFEAEVLKNQSRQFYIVQQIIETENRINFLLGRFPQTVQRNAGAFPGLVPDVLHLGVPEQLLENRTDIRQAELNLAASKLDVKSARADFYPSLNISAGMGIQAFDAALLFSRPESMFYSLTGGLLQPLINRNAIKARYNSATSKQVQAIYTYERTILNAYIEIANQLSNINNLERSYRLRTQQVEALTESIDISTRLFKSARADYMEVLLTQRDALESKFELVETKKQQLNAMVNMYQALGGGWN